MKNKILFLTYKRERKIYDAAFKAKAVQISNERDYVLELARELGIKLPFFIHEIKFSFWYS